MVPGAEPEVLREYRHLLRTASSDWQETAHRHALWALGPHGARRGCSPSCSACCSPAPGSAATTCTPSPGSSCSPSGAAPASCSTGCPPTCATTWPAPSCGSPVGADAAGRHRRLGRRATPDPPPEPPPDPDHHQRWFEQRATPGAAGELSVFLAPVPPAEPLTDRRARTAYGRAVTDIAADRARLLEIVRAKAIVHGRVTLSSGKEADYYVDLRRITLDGEASPLVGRVMLDLVVRPRLRRRRRPDPRRRPGRHVDAARRGRRRWPARRVRRAQGRQGARPPAAHRGPVDRGPPGARRRGHLDHRASPLDAAARRPGGRRHRRRRRDDRRPGHRCGREVRRRRASSTGTSSGSRTSASA